MSKPQLYIGIDAGGTKTHLQYSLDAETQPHTIEGRGTNLQRDGIQVASGILINEIIRVYAPMDTPMNLYLCAGVAGAGRTADQTALQKKLASLLELDPASISVLSDADIAYRAAHGDASGLLVTLGTGTVIWGRTHEGRMVRSGGWGYVLGDEGGGYQLGLQALRALTHAMDGGPQTMLTPLLCDQFELCNAETVLDYVYHSKKDFQRLAPAVAEAANQGDAVAAQIIEDQIERLSQHLGWLLAQHPDVNRRVVLMGGLTRHAYYKERVQAAFSDRHDALTFADPVDTPAGAALDLAKQLNG